MMQYYTHRQIMKNSLFKQSLHAACGTESQRFTPPPHTDYRYCCLSHTCLDGISYSVSQITLSVNVIPQHGGSYRCANSFGMPFLLYTHT
jgi:hypothetical protein